MQETIVLGERYRDSITGIEGVATARYEYLFGCVRVSLEHTDKDGQPKDHVFDEQRLVLARNGVRPLATATTGGPRDDPAAREAPQRP